MLEETAKWLKKKDLDQLSMNVVTESFVIHLRNIIDFLYPRTRYTDDISADDYVERPPFSERFKISSSLEAARTRADKELSHITSKRMIGIPSDKIWRVGDLLEEVITQFRRFIEIASDNKVDKQLSRKFLR